jgi:fumarate hydratase class I
MFRGNRSPAQVEIYAKGEENEQAYKFMFIPRAGLGQQGLLVPSDAVDPTIAIAFHRKVLTLGTAACPPYHLAIVIGGTSAELTMKTVKLASCRYLDDLPTHGSEDGHAFRDLDMEKEVHKLTQSLGVGAQFGGKYFCHDVRVIRLPRHGASLPIGLGVSCSADRRRSNHPEGVYLEELEHNPAQYLPDLDASSSAGMWSRSTCANRCDKSWRSCQNIRSGRVSPLPDR